MPTNSTGFIPVKPEVVVDLGLGLLERETSLAATVWRQGFGNFAGRKDDTVNVRVDAYAEANRRQLRGGGNRVRSKLFERNVPISLTHDLQVDVALTDPEWTLDVDSIARRISRPAMRGIVRAHDAEVATLMQGATYAKTVTVDGDAPHEALFDAGTALDDHEVPNSQRFVALGSALQNALVKSDRLNKVNESGSDSALRRATIGELAGFDRIFKSNFLAPWEGYAYHISAYALATAAPAVPRGVAWGARGSENGFAIRVMEHLTDDEDGDLENVVYHDAWIGAQLVRDHGVIGVDGKFTPSVEPDLDNGTDLVFVRAVKLDASALGVDVDSDVDDDDVDVDD
jgi:hypothetical protein